MEIAIVCGTRPEFVKLSPIIKECDRQKLGYFMIHTGQHYSYSMDGAFFSQLELPKPKYNLGIGSGAYSEEVSKALAGIGKVLAQEKPSIVLVYGDTNSCIAGALAAKRCGIAVGHVEAGLRSYFSGMPEEINRVIVDHCSDYLFAPTRKAEEVLINEGISAGSVYLTGNTVVDAVMQNTLAEQVSSIAGRYILATVHRQENTDSRERFASILRGLEKVADEFDMPVIYPIHPRAKKMMTEFGLWGTIDKKVQFTEPFGYLKFLRAEKHARLVLTDSGGVQEETCILGVPCVTLRDNTERPETIDYGANMLAGASADRMLECARIMIKKKPDWGNPFGDGKAGERIVSILLSQCDG